SSRGVFSSTRPASSAFTSKWLKIAVRMPSLMRFSAIFLRVSRTRFSSSSLAISSAPSSRRLSGTTEPNTSTTRSRASRCSSVIAAGSGGSGTFSGRGADSGASALSKSSIEREPDSSWATVRLTSKSSWALASVVWASLIATNVLLQAGCFKDRQTGLGREVNHLIRRVGQLVDVCEYESLHRFLPSCHLRTALGGRCPIGCRPRPPTSGNPVQYLCQTFIYLPQPSLPECWGQNASTPAPMMVPTASTLASVKLSFSA